MSHRHREHPETPSSDRRPLLRSGRSSEPRRRPSIRSTTLAGLVLAAGLGTFPVPVDAQSQFLGPQWTVNDPDATDSFPSVASNAAGTSVVVWHCEKPGVGAEICARRVSLTGRAAAGEQIVNTTSAGVQQFADVAIDEAGNFFVVWESSAAEDGAEWAVLGRAFSANGTPLGPQRVLNSQSAGRQRRPAVAWRPGSGWVATWDSTHAGFPPDIYARRISPTGVPQGAEFLVSQNAPGIDLAGLNTNAAIDTDASGNFVIAWQGPRPSGGSEVYGRRFSAAGAPRGETFRVASLAPTQKQFPSVSVNGAGAFVILFARTDDTVAARRYRANGQPQDIEFQVNQSAASPTSGSVALAEDGRFVAAWTAALGSVLPNTFSVRQRVFGANGQPLEGERLVSQRGQAPVVDLDRAGDALVVFHASGPDVGARAAQTSAQCIDSETVACVQQGRLKVEVAWRTVAGEVGVGTGELLTSETATFWFFDSSNVELVLKGLDGCALNQRLWIFAAGVTDVEIDLAVTDTAGAVVQRYWNPLGRPFTTVADTAAFACDAGAGPDAVQLTRRSRMENGSGAERQPVVQVDGAVCAGGDQRLCLNQNRFTVELRYTTATGETGGGRAVPLTSNSGYFWFFDDGNVELLVKVLDGCAINQRFWVFAAGLTDLGLRLDVVDTATSQMRRYTSGVAQGFGPVLDTSAFATCS